MADVIKGFDDIEKNTILKRIKAILAYKGFTASQKELLNRFYGYLSRSGLRLESQRAYLQNLKLLLLNLKKDINQITKEDINKYLQEIDNRFKPKTITERRKFLLTFFKWFYNKDKSEIDLIKDIRIKKDKTAKLPEELLTVQEIKQMVKVADTFRDKALIMLLYETAARKGEFLRLKIKHLEILSNKDKKFGFVTIPMGKTTSRKIPLIYSLPYVINHLNSHERADDPNAPLFMTSKAWKGRALGVDGLKRLVKVIGQKVGIKKNIFPHLFRHSRLTELGKELSEAELDVYAGWVAGSSMSRVYVHLSGKDVSDKILANAGLIDVKKLKRSKDILLQTQCPICNKFSGAEAKYCSCGAVLDLREAQKEIAENKDTRKEMDVMQKRMDELAKALEIIKLNKQKSR